jgi:hypothetical protein
MLRNGFYNLCLSKTCFLHVDSFKVKRIC